MADKTDTARSAVAEPSRDNETDTVRNAILELGRDADATFQHAVVLHLCWLSTTRNLVLMESLRLSSLRTKNMPVYVRVCRTGDDEWLQFFDAASSLILNPDAHNDVRMLAENILNDLRDNYMRAVVPAVHVWSQPMSAADVAVMRSTHIKYSAYSY